MKHDVHTATIEMIHALRSKLLDIDRRRGGVATMLANANASVQKAHADRATIANGVASGTAPATDVVVRNAAAVRDSESHALVATEASQSLEAEHKHTVAMLAEAERLQAAAIYKEALREVRRAAIQVDADGAAFGKSYQAWRAAHELAEMAWPKHMPRNGFVTTWPDIGAAGLAAGCVPKDIVDCVKNYGLAFVQGGLLASRYPAE
jgi:hypothetical protein